MRKLVLLLLLLSAKTLIAQPFTIGLTAGGFDYHFRQQTQFSSLSYYGFAVGASYLFKDSGAFSVEANVYFSPSGANFSAGTWDPYKSVTPVGYFCYNPFHKSTGVNIQLKAGFFYAQYLANTLPTGDFGPSIGLYLGVFKLSRKSYLGFDGSWMWGLQNYLIHGTGESPTPLPAANSNLSYITFSVKYVHKI